jgi:ribose transport system substrate-binding protein
MKPMRNYALILLLAGALLNGCGPEEGKMPDGKPTGVSVGKKVGVSLSSRNHNFFLGMEQGLVDELKRQGLEPIVEVAEDSASAQQQQVDTFIRKGVSAIVMVPVDAQQAITPVEAANKANIPVFCIDRRVTAPNAKVTVTVETDNVKMGEAAAREALRLLAKRANLDPTRPEDLKKLKAKIIHLWGIKEASSAQDRAKGIQSVINATNTPGITVIERYGNFNAKKAQEEVAPTLKANPDIDLILCHNDDNAMGALNAILDIKKSREAEDDPKRIFIVGMDGNKPAIAAIRKGDMEATISQEPIAMGTTTARTLKKLLEGEQPPKDYIPIAHMLITKVEANAMKGKLWSDKLRENK